MRPDDDGLASPGSGPSPSGSDARNQADGELRPSKRYLTAVNMSMNEKVAEAIALADITTCMVPVPIPAAPGQFKPCGQKFTSTRVTIIGEDSEARVNNYMAGLMKHLQVKHPQVGLMMTQHGAAFMELLFLRNFKTTDPELTEMQDRVRWQIHQQTLKARYPDENLEQQAHALAVTLVECADELPDEGFVNREPAIALYQSIVANAFRSIRDALEEPGKYDVKAPVSPKVLV